ncbi:MAG: hypothetical protein JSU85_10285 [Candidatus Zixiibacteriota bacterium]|nr:MAG: hypothetical protein JSU85_10285 [candidate division Zixibacteria bacterium]
MEAERPIIQNHTDFHNDNTILSLMEFMVSAINFEDISRKIIRTFSIVFDAGLCTLWRKIKMGNGMS